MFTQLSRMKVLLVIITLASKEYGKELDNMIDLPTEEIAAFLHAFFQNVRRRKAISISEWSRLCV